MLPRVSSVFIRNLSRAPSAALSLAATRNMALQHVSTDKAPAAIG